MSLITVLSLEASVSHYGLSIPRTVPTDPATESVPWTFTQEFQDPRAASLDFIPFSMLRIAVPAKGADERTYISWLAVMARECPELIRLDLACLRAARNNTAAYHAIGRLMNEMRMTRVCVASRLQRPDKGRKVFLPCWRTRSSNGILPQHDRIPDSYNMSPRDGFLVALP